MTTIPSPAEFLTAAYPDDEHDEPLTLDELVADLERRVSALEGDGLQVHPAEAEPVDHTERMLRESSESVHTLAADLDDLAAKHGVVLELVEEIRAIVKPSTSKVSLQVKAAIERWANPLGTETPSPAPDPSRSEPAVDEAAAGNPQDVQQRAGEGSAVVPPAVQCVMCARFFADQGLLDQHDCVPATQPAHDAPVEEWRAYARSLGRDLDTMNRSQIRTQLGIEQPAGA